jgi:bifunctional DNA-binding transcriptional regulator/antitoxin component of YhaV-PrlF toxin-antitoxin module
MLMKVKVESDHKLVLPDSICQRLGICKGDRLKAFVKEGKIVLQPIHHQGKDVEESSKNGRGRILMFGTASEAFEDEDFD